MSQNSTTKVTSESPAKRLTTALQQYSEELESIKQSLEMAMMLFSVMFEQQEKELNDFAKKHGREIKEETKSLHFNLSADKVTDFRRLESTLRKLSSSQRLMPRNLIVAMVCTYDAFLGKLIRFILESKPAVLDSSERQINFSDLQRFDSIDSVREYIIEKEIESVLRRSHIEHFKWLENKLGTPFNKGLKSWPTFVELTERRNLFVHTDGVVSSQYLAVCNEHKCATPGIVTNGSKLGVPKSYFDDAYRCLQEIGIKLAHVIWRKLLKNDLQAIDSNLCDTAYSLIQNREYDIAINVLDFFTHDSMAHSDESAKRILLINLAQAYKWNGNEVECLKLLEKHDWSASKDKFSLAVEVLKENWSKVYELMRRLKHDGNFDKNYYKEWPLFKQLRKQEDFPSVYEECYDEAFGSQETIEQSGVDKAEDCPDEVKGGGNE